MISYPSTYTSYSYLLTTLRHASSFPVFIWISLLPFSRMLTPSFIFVDRHYIPKISSLEQIRNYLSRFLFLRFAFVDSSTTNPASEPPPPPLCDSASAFNCSCTLTAFCTACLRTFSGTLSQYNSSRLPCTISSVMALSLDLCIVPVSSRPRS